MSLRCLEGLIKKSFIPSLVVISVSKGLNQQFKSEMNVICIENGIELINICDKCEQDEIRMLGKTEDLIPLIKDYDFGFSVGFMKILSEAVFSAPQNGMLNLHCGRLPQYRGRAPISRAIMEGEKSVMISVHKIDKGVDSGDVLEEFEIELNDNDDVNTIYEKCCDESGKVAIRAVKKFAKANAHFRRQEPDLAPREKISEEERKIKWNVTARIAFNKIRAITFPYPGATISYGGKEYIVLASEIVKENCIQKRQGGEILSIGERNVEVALSDGSLLLKDIFKNGSLLKDYKKEFKEGRRFK
jgi:methionyl-tRNA formyltransferase